MCYKQNLKLLNKIFTITILEITLAELKVALKTINSYFTDLTVSGDKIATYKGVPWTVNGKHITSQTLVNVQIK